VFNRLGQQESNPIASGPACLQLPLCYRPVQFGPNALSFLEPENLFTDVLTRDYKKALR